MDVVLTEPYLGWLLRGVQMTVLISLVSGCAAALLGVGVLRLRMAERRAPRVVASGFVLVFRNLPLVPLLLFLAFGLPALLGERVRGLDLALLVLGLSLNTAAYFAEILRAGVGGVPAEHAAAARTLGLSRAAIRWRVIVPQAVRIVAPALATRWVHNMKNSTTALVVPLPLGLMEVVGQAGRIAGETFSWVQPLLVAAAVHLALSLGAGSLLNRWATRQAL